MPRTRTVIRSALFILALLTLSPASLPAQAFGGGILQGASCHHVCRFEGGCHFKAESGAKRRRRQPEHPLGAHVPLR